MAKANLSGMNVEEPISLWVVALRCKSSWREWIGQLLCLAVKKPVAGGER